MSDHVLVDTGPLVAIESSRDAHHAICLHRLSELHTPLITCWPVLTEAAWLLRGNRKAIRSLLGGPAQEFLYLPVLREEATDWIAEFMDRYWAMGVQLADACLMYLAEQENLDTIFTLDVRDFSIYRRENGQPLRIIPLEASA